MGLLSLSHAIPPSFAPALAFYHLLPLHMPISFFRDAEFGRFSQKNLFNINGNIAWFLMEIVAPVTFLLTLRKQPVGLNSTSSILAGLYITHYIHRAIISPLVLSPKRSSSAVHVPILAALFNRLNGYLLAVGLVYYPAEMSTRTVLGIIGWALGFLGNVYHDEILNDLRRPEGKRLVSSLDKEETEKDKKAGNGRYGIPRGGLFELVSFPNYLSEWFEWTCFAIAAAPQVFITVPTTSPSSVGPWLGAIIKRLPWQPTTLFHPAWMFLVFEIASMLPRAARGHRWYYDTFGQRYPKSRKIVFPWLY